MHKILLVVDNELAKARQVLASLTGTQPAPKKERKPRGPNKPKLAIKIGDTEVKSLPEQASLPLAPAAKPAPKSNGAMPTMPGQAR